MACMHDEIVRNIRTIVRFMAAAYLKRHQVSAIDFITDSFQLSTDQLAAGAEPAADLAAAEKTLVSVRNFQLCSFVLFLPGAF